VEDVGAFSMELGDNVANFQILEPVKHLAREYSILHIGLVDDNLSEFVNDTNFPCLIDSYTCLACIDTVMCIVCLEIENFMPTESNILDAPVRLVE
jgi:hypothetical protein